MFGEITIGRLGGQTDAEPFLPECNGRPPDVGEAGSGAQSAGASKPFRMEIMPHIMTHPGETPQEPHPVTHLGAPVEGRGT